MKELLLTISLSFIITMLWSPLLISTLYKFNVVRQGDKDFSHLVGERYLKAGTPIMGGLLIIVTTVIITLVTNWNGNTYVPLGVFLLSAALGGVDDLLNIYGRKRIVRTIKKQIVLAKVHKSHFQRVILWLELPWVGYKNIWYALGSYPGTGIQAGEKIIIQILSSLPVVWWIYTRLGWDSISIPFIGLTHIGILMPILIVLAVIGMSNAVNLADGMDGLASGMLIPAYAAYMFIALNRHNMPLALLCAAVVGSLAAYLYFNIKPARIEMSDVGSLALGALLSTIALALDAVSLLPIIALMFVLTVGSSLIQAIYRRVFGKRLLKMAPMHLHFQVKGWSEEKIVMRFWLFAWIFSIIGLLLSFY
ncbi:phospho-N-acetylmuramoyl-pentapeptide-transferase [Candidatus Dojkabacteria bacterium]|uniref:Phospho-N-acetylmuramoyl-pentapeptide-transferase n=1 Tax=Candidatus Dojkabacteria bacterium TaxID=2099670 RepID=A0A955HXP3_9BACT|nr:phospho-N-acetylmuramoyl-pentapeptide-transferase [Candidatus Dojkabacteria bacterium]